MPSLVYGEVGAEDVPHDAEVGLYALNGEAEHGEVLRQQCLAMPLHNKLKQQGSVNYVLLFIVRLFSICRYPLHLKLYGYQDSNLHKFSVHFCNTLWWRLATSQENIRPIQKMDKDIHYPIPMDGNTVVPQLLQNAVNMIK